MTPALEIALRPSRLRRLAALLLVLLAWLVAPAQAIRLEAPWPLVLLSLPLLLARLSECEPRRLRLADERVEVRTARGTRSGRIDGAPSATAFALEFPVRWAAGGRTRVVVWRDAADDADYRHLARTLRRLPAAAPEGAARP